MNKDKNSPANSHLMNSEKKRKILSLRKLPCLSASRLECWRVCYCLSGDSPAKYKKISNEISPLTFSKLSLLRQ